MTATPPIGHLRKGVEIDAGSAEGSTGSSSCCEWRRISPLVTFEISPVFVTAGHPGHARDGRRPHRITEAPPAGGREDAVIKLGELVMILDLHRQGLSVSAIARQVGIDRKTVRTYIAKGLEPPAYKKRATRPSVVDRFEPYLRERLAAFPALTARRLLRELNERDFPGSYSVVRDRVREIRPARTAGYEVRFETPPGEQAQVDFARFEVEFADEPGVKRIVWLFSMVLGYSRLIWARFVLHQDLQSVLRCHIAAFEAIGGAPRTILYDRMKTNGTSTAAGRRGRSLFARSVARLHQLRAI